MPFVAATVVVDETESPFSIEPSAPSSLPSGVDDGEAMYDGGRLFDGPFGLLAVG